MDISSFWENAFQYTVDRTSSSGTVYVLSINFKDLLVFMCMLVYILVCVLVCVHGIERDRSSACYDKTDERSVKSKAIVFRIAHEQKAHTHKHCGGRKVNVTVISTEITCSLTDRQKN